MNPILLRHFFDRDRWTFELLRAFFKLQPRWSIDQLRDEFVMVCIELQAPRGSAGSVIEWLNKFHFNGCVTVDKTGDVTYVARTDKLKLAGTRSGLVHAIHWARGRRQVGKEEFCDLARAGNDFKSGLILSPVYQRRTDRIKREAAARLAYIDRSFKLKPEEKA